MALIGAYGFIESEKLFAALADVICSGKTVKNEIQLTDALALLLQRGEPIQPIYMQDWFDCGTVESLLYANRALLERMPACIPAKQKSSQIVPPCWIDPSAVVENCVLGPYVSVGEKAHLCHCNLQDSIVPAQSHLEHIHGTHLIINPHAED